MQKKFV